MQNIVALHIIKQTLMGPKQHIDIVKIIGGDFNTRLSSLDTSSKLKNPQKEDTVKPHHR